MRTIIAPPLVLLVLFTACVPVWGMLDGETGPSVHEHVLLHPPAAVCTPMWRLNIAGPTSAEQPRAAAHTPSSGEAGKKTRAWTNGKDGVKAVWELCLMHKPQACNDVDVAIFVYGVFPSRVLSCQNLRKAWRRKFKKVCGLEESQMTNVSSQCSSQSALKKRENMYVFVVCCLLVFVC